MALFAGEWILAFFGISVSSFSVGGGILILLMAISMLHARLSLTVQTKEEAEESDSKGSIAIVPLATPLLAGLGAMSTVVLVAHEGTSFGHYALISLAIITVGTCIWMALHMAPWISQRLGKTGINIFTRIMGLFLTAIAVEFIAKGLRVVSCASGMRTGGEHLPSPRYGPEGNFQLNGNSHPSHTMQLKSIHCLIKDYPMRSICLIN